MKIIKRNGTAENVDFNKIVSRINKGIKYLTSKGIDVSGIDEIELAKEAINKLTDFVTATQMDEYIASMCADRVTYDSGYMYLAGYIAHTSLIKNVYTHLGVNSACEGLYKLCELGVLSYEFKVKLNRLVNNDDLTISLLTELELEVSEPLTYFAVKTFERTYLLKLDHIIVETPSMCRLRAAINLSSTWSGMLDAYAGMLKHKFTPATPILMNSGKKLQNLASCYLFNNESDSFQGIQNTFNEAMSVSRLAGGVGIHLHNIRAKGTEIKSAGEPAAGFLPLLRQYVAGLRTWNQSGKRMGSAAIYLEPWHADIRDFLNAANPHSPISIRVDELFYALWVPDLFMKQVKDDGDWYLFCPTKLERAGFEPLQTLWGSKFEDVYYSAIEAKVYNEKVKARDIWNLMIETQLTSGKPYVCFKDNANANNAQFKMGTLQGSNLCAEIYEYTSSTHTAVCNLGSITAHQFLPDDVVNTTCLYDSLYSSAYTLAAMLNKAIDETAYVSGKMSISNLMLRPIAIGVQGMAELLVKLGLGYDSPEAMDVQENVIKAIYKGATDQGLHNKCNNTLHVALMPTASTSQILNNTESFEPMSGIVYKRNTNSGEFTVLQPMLITALKNRGLWNKEMRDILISNPDSIQDVQEIPEDIRKLFKTVWDVPLTKHVEASIRRQRWVDQGQSLNLYMPELDAQALAKALFQGWKGGLKTGLYYLRSKAAGKKRNIT
jgi:ribonucleoside-diphosphate reductase alpha chain